MSSSSVPVSSTSSPTPGDIDASFRLVALFLAGKSAFWLVLGGLMNLLASVKLHAPAMMSGKAWLTYGRLAPAGWDALVYGFAGQVGFGLGLWLLARSSKQKLQAPLVVLAGLVIWNFGVLIGIAGILTGHSTGRELLEMPYGCLASMVVGAGLVGAAGWATFAARTERQGSVSTWFVLLSLLSFVWFASGALMLLPGDGSRGVAQVLIQRWYAGGAMKLWLGGAALAVLFEGLPRLANRPLASRSLALWTFWCLVCFTPWAVTSHGDPFPRWVISAGLMGGYLGFMGFLAAGMNWRKTLEGGWGRLFESNQGRLMGVSALSYLTVGAFGVLGYFRGFGAVVRLTWFELGVDWLFVGGTVILAFVSILPEFLAVASGRRLAPRLVQWHAGLTLGGVLLTGIPLILAGVAQGLKLSGPGANFMEALLGSMNFVRLSTLGLTAFLVGQVFWCVALAGWFKEMSVEVVDTVRGWAAPLTSKRAGARS